MEEIIECPYCGTDVDHDPYTTVHPENIDDSGPAQVTFRDVLFCWNEDCLKSFTVDAHFDFSKLEVVYPRS